MNTPIKLVFGSLFITILTGISLAQTVLDSEYWDPAVGGNGHTYEFVDYGAGQYWRSAAAAAHNDYVLGQSESSNLVRILSAAEQQFLIDNLPLGTGNSFIGASDISVDGEWRWVTDGGLDNGALFYLGHGNTTPRGQVQPGYYTNWNGTEPNGGRSYGYMYTSGRWDDSNPSLRYSVVERVNTPGGYFINTVAGGNWWASATWDDKTNVTDPSLEYPDATTGASIQGGGTVSVSNNDPLTAYADHLEVTSGTLEIYNPLHVTNWINTAAGSSVEMTNGELRVSYGEIDSLNLSGNNTINVTNDPADPVGLNTVLTVNNVIKTGELNLTKTGPGELKLTAPSFSIAQDTYTLDGGTLQIVPFAKKNVMSAVYRGGGRNDASVTYATYDAALPHDYDSNTNRLELTLTGGNVTDAAGTPLVDKLPNLVTIANGFSNASGTMQERVLLDWSIPLEFGNDFTRVFSNPEFTSGQGSNWTGGFYGYFTVGDADITNVRAIRKNNAGNAPDDYGSFNIYDVANPGAGIDGGVAWWQNDPLQTAVTLNSGQTYAIFLGFAQGGGGAEAEYQMSNDGGASYTTINPADESLGYWWLAPDAYDDLPVNYDQNFATKLVDVVSDTTLDITT